MPSIPPLLVLLYGKDRCHLGQASRVDALRLRRQRIHGGVDAPIPRHVRMDHGIPQGAAEHLVTHVAAYRSRKEILLIEHVGDDGRLTRG